MKFILTPWRRFYVYKDRKAIRFFLDDVGKTTKKKLSEGILNPPKTGRLYGSHRASAPGEYPANKTGVLARSITIRRTSNDVTIGTTVSYGKYLADGTYKMAPRKMSKEAMQAAIPEARARFRRWIYFKHR